MNVRGLKLLPMKVDEKSQHLHNLQVLLSVLDELKQDLRQVSPSF